MQQHNIGANNISSDKDTKLSAIKKPAPLLAVESFIDPKVETHDDFEEKTAAEESYKDKFLKSIMDQTKEYLLPVPVISIHQKGETIPFLTLKSFSLWQGKQKSKKTTVLALAVAAFIRDTAFVPADVGFTAVTEGTVLFFDNEQGESYAARTMKLILKLAGIEYSSKLVYCDLREFSPIDRKRIIEAGIECTPNVKMVVIDGLVDLLNDFMDAGEGHITTTEILKLCSIYDIHIAGVLHQNKNDKNARAHIGTISSQKCEIEISTEVDPNDRAQSQVICVNSRGIPFEPFAIRWDKGSLPSIVQDWTAAKANDAKANKNYEKIKTVADDVFKPLTSLTYTEAIKGIMNALSMSKDTAKRRLQDLLEWDIVSHGPDGRYRRNSSKGAKVQTGANEGA